MTSDSDPLGTPRRGAAFGLACLMGLVAAGCAAPWILPAEGGAGHQFMIGEDSAQHIRKITVWLEPGHVLAWEVIRAPDEGRRGLPLTELDYGTVPGAMDQVYPKGNPEPLRTGQVVTVALEYGPDSEFDPVVPDRVTRWFRKESQGFSPVTEREALDARPPKEGGEDAGKP